jgi:hypothetical protein
MHAEGLGNAGAEAISLDQCTHKRTDIVNPSPINQISQGFRARLSGSQFEVDKVKFIAQIRVRVMEILSDPHESLVKSQASFDADDGEVEGIGKSQANAILAVPDHALQDEAGQNKPQSCNPNDQRKIIESGEGNDSSERNHSQEDARSEVVVDIDRIAKPGLDEPRTRAGDVRGRERKGLANGIQCLLEAFPDRRFVLSRFWLLTAEGSQASSKDRTRRKCGGAEGEDGTHHGEEYNDDEN